MSGPVPILLAGGAALLLMGGKKKGAPKKKSLAGQPCDVAVGTPEGMVCVDGVLHPDIIDESMLERDEDPSGEDAGDFETKEEDVSLGDGEEESQVTLEDSLDVDPSTKCDEFLQAIHVAPTEEGEIPINKVAVEQTAIPAMESTMHNIRKSIGGKYVDAESMGPPMVLSALQELVPVCDWKYDDNDYEFTYSDGMKVESDEGRDVIFGLMKLSAKIIEDFNKKQDEGLPSTVILPANQQEG